LTIGQFIPALSERDAVSNEVGALSEVFEKLGCRSVVYFDKPSPVQNRHASRLSPGQSPKCDVLLVHYTHSSEVYERIFALPCPKVLVYHNVTPPALLPGVNPELLHFMRLGRERLPRYAGKVILAVAHSQFSLGDLKAAGYRNTFAIPYLLHERTYTIEPDKDLMRDLQGTQNIIMVNRVFPHKCIEDGLFVYDYYRRKYCPGSRLRIIGGWEGADSYFHRLLRLASRLSISESCFTGSIPQSALLAYYQSADAFLCMSEHEGFCVPLVEAMRYGVPVFAYDAGSVAETLRGGGILFPCKDWPEMAKALYDILSSASSKERLLSAQNRGVEYYSPSNAQGRLAGMIELIKGRMSAV
jgi:L-malate glycosyltransferase